MTLNLTAALYDVLAGDATLTADLSTYRGSPSVFTTDPAPGDAELPYLVSAGEVTSSPFDTKTSQGRDVFRDIRCYTAAAGSAELVERIAERVRALFHRQTFTVAGHTVVVASVGGPIQADEPDAYGRVVTLHLILSENADLS